LVGASKVSGTSVYDTKGEHLGSIEDLMIDKMTGQVHYAILSFGGIFEIVRDYYPVPWEKLDYDTDLGGFRLNITKEKLERAPKCTNDHPWSDWKGVDTYYAK
jgi:hypothetical protein